MARYLARYDALAARAKDVVDLPDRRLADLLVLIHQSNGHISNNKRKQRFEELTNEEIAAIESAYAEVFQLPDQSIVPVGGVAQSPDEAVGVAQEAQQALPLPSPRKEPSGHKRQVISVFRGDHTTVEAKCWAVTPQANQSALSRIYANCRSLLAGDFKARIACKQAPTPIT